MTGSRTFIFFAHRKWFLSKGQNRSPSRGVFRRTLVLPSVHINFIKERWSRLGWHNNRKFRNFFQRKSSLLQKSKIIQEALQFRDIDVMPLHELLLNTWSAIYIFHSYTFCNWSQNWQIDWSFMSIVLLLNILKSLMMRDLVNFTWDMGVI